MSQKALNAQGELGEIENFRPTVQEPIPVRRCTGPGRPHWALRGTTVCKNHGGFLPTVQLAAAAQIEAGRLRLIDDIDIAIDALEDLAQNAGSEAVRKAAATDILDRAGIRPGVELDITVEESGVSASERIAKKLASLREVLVPQDDIIEAEVIEDSQQETLF